MKTLAEVSEPVTVSLPPFTGMESVIKVVASNLVPLESFKNIVSFTLAPILNPWAIIGGGSDSTVYPSK